MATFTYDVSVRWTGNTGAGTAAYDGYARDHVVGRDGLAPIDGSVDRRFRGSPGRWTPEELFVASLSACHRPWYLHLCADAGVVVCAYHDAAAGTMVTQRDGSGWSTLVTLRPRVEIERGSVATAGSLHDAAHAACLIANSTNVPIVVEPAITLRSTSSASPPPA